MLFKKAGAKHFVHLLLRIGLYCIKSFIIYYLLLYPFYSQLSMRVCQESCVTSNL